MRKTATYPKRKYYIILFSVVGLLILFSLDVFMRVKDYSLFLVWENSNSTLLDGLSEEERFNMYTTAHMSYYFVKVAVLIGFGVQSYFTFAKNKFTSLYVTIWMILLTGSFAYHFLELNFYSVFYILITITYLVLILTLASLYNVLSLENNERSVSNGSISI